MYGNTEIKISREFQNCLLILMFYILLPSYITSQSASENLDFTTYYEMKIIMFFYWRFPESRGLLMIFIRTYKYTYSEFNSFGENHRQASHAIFTRNLFWTILKNGRMPFLFYYGTKCWNFSRCFIYVSNDSFRKRKRMFFLFYYQNTGNLVVVLYM